MVDERVEHLQVGGRHSEESSEVRVSGVDAIEDRIGWLERGGAGGGTEWRGTGNKLRNGYTVLASFSSLTKQYERIV